jgi:hypothetical protein
MLYIYHLLKHEEPNVLSVQCLYVFLMSIIINYHYISSVNRLVCTMVTQRFL